MLNSMIFKTRNNELAIFGKTLTETKGILIDFFEAFEHGGIKGNDGVIDTFFSKNKKSIITPEVLSQFDDFKGRFNNSQLSAEALAEEMGVVNSAIVNYAKTCKNGELTTEGFTTAIKQQTLSAKAATVATKALAIAGNMIAMLAISEVVSLAVEKIDDLAHSAENCAERADELMSSYKSALDTANSNAGRVEELADKYEELSKGVNNLGQNVSLTSDEYEEYNEIVNEIADMFPTLIQGYTNEGNAILSLKGNVDELRNAYKEAQQEAYNMLIVSGEDSDGNDIIANFQNKVSGIHGLFQQDTLGSMTITNWLEDLKSALNTDDIDAFRDSIADLYEFASDNNEGYHSDEFQKILDDTGIKDLLGGITNIYALDEEALQRVSDKIKGNLSTIQSYIQTYQSETESALAGIHSLANAYLMTNEDYADLDDNAKTAASLIANSINAQLASEFEDKSDVGAYVANIVSMIKDNPNVQNALNGLFTTDFSSLSYNDAKAVIDQYIDTIAELTKRDPVELKATLGFSDYDDNENLVNNVKEKLQDEFDNKVGTLTLADLEIASKLEIPDGTLLSWDELLECIQKVKSETSNNETDTFTLFTEDQSEAIDDFQSKVTTLSDALSALRSGSMGNGALTDLIQEFPELEGQSNNLEQGIIDLINNALQELYTTLGEGLPSDIKDDLQAIANEATGIAPALDTAFSNIQNSYDVLQDFKNAMSTGMTDEVLSSVGALSSKLNDLVAGFYVGAVSADQLFEALTEHYNTDLQNYANALIAKNQYSEAFYNAIGLASAEVVNQFLHDYGIDLSNCRTYNEAKLAIEKQTMQKISSIWSQYYSVQYDAATGMGDAAYESLKESAAHGDAAAIAQLAAIQQQADKYKAAAGALDQLASAAINDTYKGITSTYKNASSTGGSSASETTKTSIDWLSRKLERLQEKIDLTKSKFENLFTLKDKSKNLNKQIEQTTKLLTAAQKAAKKYQKLANSIVLSSDETQNQALKKKVQNGAYSITEYDSSTAEKINQYQEYYDSYKEQLQQIEELKASIRELEIEIYQTKSDYQQSRIDKLDAQIAVTTSTQKKNQLENDRVKALKRQYELEIKIAKAEGDTIKAKQLALELEAEINASKKTKFDNIVAKYDNREARKQYNIEDIENAIAVTEAKGSIVNADYYRQEYEKQQALYQMYQEEEAALQSRLSTLTKYSDEWYDALSTIQDVQNKESETIVTMEELADKVNEVAKALDDLIVNKFESLISEADTLLSLLGDDLLDDASGSFTKNGIAALGLYISQMELAKSTGEQLNRQLAILEQQKNAYKDGETITFIDANGNERTISSLKELSEEIESTRSSAQEQIKSEYSYYRQIVDIVKERYEAEQTCIDDLISKKKELLDAEQDLHAYAKDIREQTDNISSLQKQLAALSGDNSLEGQARRQQLEARLEESKDSLAETEYDRLISDQKEMLDNLSNELAELTETYTKDEEALFREGLATAKENTALINDTINTLAAQWNVNLSDELQSVVGNIGTVETTLNGIRSDLQNYFSETQANGGQAAAEMTAEHLSSTRDALSSFTFPEDARNHGSVNRENLNLISLYEMSKNIVDAAVTSNFDHARTSLSDTPQRAESAIMSVGDVTFSFPRDYDYQTFMRQAQADPNFEHMIGSFIKTELSGGNRLSKFSSRF